jgi:hypothetical protein
MTRRALGRREPESAPVAVLPDGTPVTLVKPDGATRPVLGTREPAKTDEVARRVRALEAWGGSPRGARPQREAAIEEALPLRSRTVLSHDLPPEVAARIEGSR